MENLNFTIINGPNLNLLGKREPELYGSLSFEAYFENLKQKYPACRLNYFQSNIEGELISAIQKFGFSHNGLIINPGGYTHTSVAMGDAIAAVPAPALEVHISNVYRRESFRHISLVSAKCVGSIIGLGLLGYDLAIEWLIQSKK